MKNYFEYGLLFPRVGPHQYLITMRFPKSMEKEVRGFYQDGQGYFDDDSDWEIAEEWERQYFIDGRN